MGRRVIFLDIDGVLAPIRDRDRYGDLDGDCIQVLNDIAARGRADVVVSSSWRFGKTIAQLQHMLAEQGFAGCVVGATPTDLPGLTRGEEIAVWLDAHPVDAFVILDDHRDVGALVGHLVQTHPSHGLRPADTERALAVLAAPVVG